MDRPSPGADPAPEKGPPADKSLPEIADLDPNFDLSAFGSEGPSTPPSPADAATGPEAPKADAAAASAEPPAAPVKTPSDASLAAPFTPRAIGAPPARPETPAAVEARSAPADDPTPALERPVVRTAYDSGRFVPPPPRSRRPLVIVGAMLAIAAVAAAIFTWRWSTAQAGAAAPVEGLVLVESTPPGADVFVAGQSRGKTPLELRLAPGTHPVEIVAGDDRRPMSVTAVAGTRTVHHLHMSPAAAAGGGLQISSTPTGARVILDEIERGVTPLTLDDVAPGEHQLTVTGPGGSLSQTVVVEAGTTTAVVVPLEAAARAAHAGGWIAASAPVDMQIFQGDRLLGTTRTERLMLPAGRQTLTFVSEDLGIRLDRTVTVVPGAVQSVRVALPNGTLNINALPWADVSIDGTPAGQTPLADVEVPAGRHEVRFVHPELGERRQQIVVRAGETTRVTADLRRQP